MKKAISMGVVILLILGIICGVMFIWVAAIRVNQEYTQADIDKAQTDGKNEGNAYKEYLENLIKDLSDKINDADNADKLTEIEEKYAGLVDSVNEQLQEQGDSIEELAEAKLDSLQSMRSSLASLKTVYESELADLKIQLKSINDAIADLEELSGNYSGEILGFEYAKVLIVSDISRHEGNISNLAAQISELDGLILTLSGGAV